MNSKFLIHDGKAVNIFSIKYIKIVDNEYTHFLTFVTTGHSIHFYYESSKELRKSLVDIVTITGTQNSIIQKIDTVIPFVFQGMVVFVNHIISIDKDDGKIIFHFSDNTELCFKNIDTEKANMELSSLYSMVPCNFVV